MESGYHSEHWFELDGLFANAARVQPFASELGRRLLIHQPDFICGPQKGGARLAQMIAEEFGREYVATDRIEAPEDLSALFSVRYTVPEPFRARLRGKTVAIVDDAISAGSAVRGTYADLIACGAQPVAFGALIVFGDKAVAFATEHALPLEQIARAEFNMWPPSACPLCRRSAPLEVVSDAR